MSQGPTPTPFMHVVQSGDTLLGIAIRYGVELEELLLANPTVDPGFLTLGGEVLIPGPEGEPAGSLLPTPTPVALALSVPDCYENPIDGIWCLVVAQNPTDNYIEGAIVQTSIVDQDGEILQSKPAIGAVNLIAPGQGMPFLSSFDIDPGSFFSSSATVISAVQTSDISERYLPVEIGDRQVEIDPTGQFAQVDADFSIEGEIAEEDVIGVRIAVVALNSAGVPVGLVILELEPEPGTFTDTFSTLIGSLGPEIQDVEILIEARNR